MNPIYLDYNGTTPIDPQIAESMAPFINEHFGNPSSSHYFGAEPRSALDKARGQVANMLGCQPHEVIFTSGGTESNNQAVRGVIDASNMREPHLITSSVEHPSIINVCRFLEKGDQIEHQGTFNQGLVSQKLEEHGWINDSRSESDQELIQNFTEILGVKDL